MSRMSDLAIDLRIEYPSLPSEDQLSQALHLAAMGWPVFPCRGKVPMTSHGFKDGTLDPEQIRAWWTSKPLATIGVALPVGTMAVDVDDVDDFAAAALPLPEGPGQATPSGGYHRLLNIGERAAKQTQGHFPGADTRVGGKGYVIAWEPWQWRTVDALPPAPDWALAR